jgi:hypothetical protein
LGHCIAGPSIARLGARCTARGQVVPKYSGSCGGHGALAQWGTVRSLAKLLRVFL